MLFPDFRQSPADLLKSVYRNIKVLFFICIEQRGVQAFVSFITVRQCDVCLTCEQ